MQQQRQNIPVQQAECRVRAALPSDIPALMRLKRALAAGEDGLHVVRASADDWLRDGFGPHAGFTAFVAEIADAVIGMATCSERTITRWRTNTAARSSNSPCVPTIPPRSDFISATASSRCRSASLTCWRGRRWSNWPGAWTNPTNNFPSPADEK
jgi:hypothetical protein